MSIPLTAEVAELKRAIDANEFDRVAELMTRNPSLHCAPLGYGNDGPLTWVAECRVPREPPGAVRLRMAKWMIGNGSDIHQGGDGPLMRAALGDRIAMMELLVGNGADVNAHWHGHYPIIFAPCETLDALSLNWLLEHGANPDCGIYGTALDFVIATYLRSPEDLAACIEILMQAGVTTRFNVPAVMAILRGRTDELTSLLDRKPDLLHRRFPELDFGETGTRRMRLLGATLLHVAAEYGNWDAAQLLIDRGADVNARAAVNDRGVGGQTPIFHAASQSHDSGKDVARLLIEKGADLSIRARLPGHYERAEEVVEATPLEYAARFPGGESATVALLREYATG